MAPETVNTDDPDVRIAELELRVKVLEDFIKELDADFQYFITYRQKRKRD